MKNYLKKYIGVLTISAQLIILSVIYPSICLAEFFAGHYESYYTTKPKMVILRYEVVDTDSRSPISNAEVRLEGDIDLRATTGKNGVVVFGLSWKPWEYSYDHDVARVRSLSTRHMKYKYLQVSKTGLEPLLNEADSYYIYNYKHIGEFEEWLKGTASRIFFFNRGLSRPEFFNRIRKRQYGSPKLTLYHSINKNENRSGPFLVLEKEIRISKINHVIIIR